MTTLKDFQFELLPSLDAADGEVFGLGTEVSLDDGGFHPGPTEWGSQDSESSSRGTTNFGRDNLLGPTWAWDLHVNTTDTEEAVVALSRFSAAWRALQIRKTPGAVLPLRYKIAGRVRRVYGRPRRNEGSPDNRILSGMMPFGVDFKAVDGFTYDDVSQSLLLTINASESEGSGGGITFPVTFPHSSKAPTTQTQTAVVGGDAPATPRIRFNGPVENPTLHTDDWTLTLAHSIPDGQYVEIDTRPWAMTVMLNGDTSIAGALGRRQRLTDVVLQPGTSLDMTFGGYSSNGTATCQIWWDHAWNSW